MELAQRKYLVFGAGISGIGATDVLLKIGAEVILYDGNENIDKEVLLGNFKKGQPKLVLGKMTKELAESVDVAVLSPGVPADSPDVMVLRAANVEIWGEVELSFHLEKGLLFAVTGTNGKTTTTSLLGEIVKNYNPKSSTAGNIGKSYTEWAYESSADSATVLEVSSFQLETTVDFHPHVCCILNITPDHLDRHHTFANYIKAKEDVSKNQTGEDFIILNYEDEYTRDFGGRTKAKVIYFSSEKVLEEGLYLDGDAIMYRMNGNAEELCRTGELKLLGKHNFENVMAACGMAIAANIPMDVIKKTIREFTAVEHRIEFAGVKRGVYYYNDSKGTNPDAAIKGIQAMNRPTVLIGGGYDKGSEYDEWINAFDGKVKLLVLIGQTKEKIAECAVKCGFPKDKIVMAETYEECLEICTANAVEGDAVLLSPACASWGMFKNYEQRGDMFKEYVKGLAE